MRFGEIVRDAAGLSAIGIALGLAVNALSPRGLNLRRDYFAGIPLSPTAAPKQSTPTESAGSSVTKPAPSSGMSNARRQRLAERGIGIVDFTRAAELFEDAGYASGRIVFIDARDDAHFQAGHIRGARQLDHYHVEQYIADILSACALAKHVVVYCNGGECEDSELAANDLFQFGVPAAKLLVYAGGITEWRARGMPVESDPRTGRAGSRP